MDKWEHRVIALTLIAYKGANNKTYKDFGLSLDGKEIIGQQNILDHYGDFGWELVAVTISTVNLPTIYLNRKKSN